MPPSPGSWCFYLLAIGSIFSWSIMVTKLRVIQFARKQNARFLAAFDRIGNRCASSKRMHAFPGRRSLMFIARAARK